MALLNLIPESLRDRELQFRAIRGDLRHRLEVYEYFCDFSPAIADLWDKAVQAAYLDSFYPTLVPPEYSAHSVSTLFEDYYFRAINFRARYITWLAQSFPEGQPTRTRLFELLPSLRSRLEGRWIHD